MPISRLRRLHRKVVSDDNLYRRAIDDRLRMNPRDPDALFARAALFASEHRNKEAIESLNDLAKVAPHYPGLWRFKAQLYHDMGETRLASLCREKGDASL